MKPMQNHILNDCNYTVRHSLAQDLHFELDIPYVFDLDHLAALNVTGQNSSTFLQGQLTCDVLAIDDNAMRPGGLCTLQGRLIALLDVVNWQTIHLILPKDLLASCQAALAKAALFSRVNVQENISLSCVGLYLPETAELNLGFPLPQQSWHSWHNPEQYCYALGDRLWILLFPTSSEKNVFLEQFRAEQQRGSLAWHYLELQRQRMTIYPNTRGLFLPHRLGLHTTAYLSFNKGCYKGQEIIARTHYRAKLKHHLQLMQIQTSEPIFAGQTCYLSPEHTEVGEIIDYCPIGENAYLLALSILMDAPQDVYFSGHTQPTHLNQLR